MFLPYMRGFELLCYLFGICRGWIDSRQTTYEVAIGIRVLTPMGLGFTQAQFQSQEKATNKTRVASSCTLVPGITARVQA